MIRMTVKDKISFPKILIQDDLLKISNQIFIPIMAEGIDKQVAIDGGALKPNSPKYTRYKIKKGLSPKILIATGELRRSFVAKKKGKNAVVVTLNKERKTIGSYLEDMGKHFFGINKRMENSAVNYMKNKIRELIRGRK